MVICFSEIDKKVHLNKLLHMSLFLSMIFVYNPIAISNFIAVYKNQRDTDEYKIAEYIKKNSGSQDTIFVLGGQPIIYFLSERKAPTKYFFWLFHYGRWKDILQTEENSFVFLKNKPKYIVLSKDNYCKIEYVEKLMSDNYHVSSVFNDYILYEINGES